MGIRHKLLSHCARFKNDERGSFGMVWSLSALAIIFALGSAYDASQASKAKQLAQTAADNMALTASIAVDRGNQNRYIEGELYKYSEIGGPTEDFTGSMKGSVEYDVIDGDEKLIARATITGKYTTAFMSMIGVKNISLSAVSDVAYKETGGVPTSVFFIADNSGSMGDNDDTGVQKLQSLESSLQNFMTTLETLDTDGTADTFRTALYPFSADPSNDYSEINSDGVIPTHTVSPDWGTLTAGEITRMIKRYGTDSSGALQDAADAFDVEGAAHIAVNGESEPLKFAVFMTDGSNNSSYECHSQPVFVPNDPEYWVDTYPGENNRIYTSWQSWFDGWVIYYPASEDGYYEDQNVCSTDYHFDRRSLEACSQMKSAGAIVYAIAYDLEVSYPYSPYVTQAEVDRAEEFLEQCSSGEDYFKTASDSSALEEAFEQIGESILEEVIRIKR